MSEHDDNPYHLPLPSAQPLIASFGAAMMLVGLVPDARLWRMTIISMGACASCGGVFDNYAIVQGCDQIVPIDVFVPGCPPRPESLIYGIIQLQRKIDKSRMSA